MERDRPELPGAEQGSEAREGTRQEALGRFHGRPVDAGPGVQRGRQLRHLGRPQIPKPFSDSGRAGNPVFERNYKAVVKKLPGLVARQGVKILHLPWYGYQWAEIYNGSAVQPPAATATTPG